MNRLGYMNIIEDDVTSFYTKLAKNKTVLFSRANAKANVTTK